MVCKLVQSRSNVRYLHVYTRSIPDIVQSSIIYVIINLHRNPKSYGGECKRYTANRFGLNLSLSLPLPRPWTWESVRREVHRKLDRWSVSSLGGIAIDHRMIHRRTLDVIQYKRGTSLSLSLTRPDVSTASRNHLLFLGPRTRVHPGQSVSTKTPSLRQTLFNLDQRLPKGSIQSSFSSPL